MHDEPIMDVAHLAHVELLTPKPEESLRFFVDCFGMTESGRRGESVYLRGWDDYERHSLKLTAANIAGMGHVAYRARARRRYSTASAIESSGRGMGWTRATSATARPIASPPRRPHHRALLRDRVVQAPPELRPR